ncbi:MAG: hypothetical protein WC475_01635 [Candidatus Paceibacterota bacterium]|jgi:hypothetical protein
MGIRHKAVKASRDTGYASEWNDDHEITDDVDFLQNEAQNMVTHSGIAFPAGPVVGQRFFRTDLAREFYWSGAAWSDTATPIGTIQAWMKSLAGTPALPDCWVECNGQVLADAQSVYNGATIPDLNGNNNFLRGNGSSGTTGGSATLPNHLHTWGPYEHRHDLPFSDSSGDLDFSTGSFGGQVAMTGKINFTPMPQAAEASLQTMYAGNPNPANTSNPTSNPSTLPPYYNVVWIMRVK